MKRIMEVLKNIHRSEQGAEGLEKLLIVAAIVLPLLGILIYFRRDIGAWTGDQMEQIKGESDIDTSSSTGN